MVTGINPPVNALSVGGLRRRPLTLTWVGVAALAVAVGASGWIAVGAAGSGYLLQLPGHADPPWVAGPLRLLGGSLPRGQLSVALAVLAVSYVVALRCAPALSPRVVLGAIVGASVIFALAPTLVSSDVFGYIAYAREAAAHGLNPYVAPPIALGHDAILPFVYWRHQPSPYGPLFTILGLPLGLTSPAVALWSLKAVTAAASIALTGLVGVLARRRGVDPARAMVLVGLNPVLIVYAVSGAHNDVLGALAVTVALTLVARGRAAAGGAAAIAAVGIKVTFGLALPFVLIAARRRDAAARGAALAAAALTVPTLLLFGGHVIDQVRRIASQPLFDVAFSGPDRLAAALGMSIDGTIRLVCTAAGAAVALAMIGRAWRGGDPVAAMGWAFLALIASIASLAPWYLVWLLPLAAVGRSRALRVATLVATAYLLAVHLPALGGQPWLTPPSSAARGDHLYDPRAGIGDVHAAGATVDGHRIRLASGRIGGDETGRASIDRQLG